MTPTPKLEAGRYFGETVRRRDATGLTVNEVRFAPRASLPRHSHDRSIFSFVLFGGYTECSDWKRSECLSPVMLFHPAGQAHWERFSRLGARCLTVELDPAWIDSLEDDRHALERPLMFKRGEWTWIAGPLRQELYVRDDLSPMVVEAYVRLLLAAGVRSTLRGAAPPPFLQRAFALLNDRYTEHLELGEIARDLGVHPTHLARAFRRHYQTSPGEYVRRLRVEFACRELASSRRSLAEIARLAGFADQSHFTRTFKRLTGTTPARYRSEIVGN